ncbi:phage holin [Peribacillus muralis]|uniref:phage holin n=1 Tax=Peribacillus muralis TaxID=264697 RepID=UPI003D084513
MDKAKQYVAMIGGALGALLLFFQSLDFQIDWFNESTINSFVNFLTALIPLVFVGYGIYKNQFLLTKAAQKQEEVLKKQGLK